MQEGRFINNMENNLPFNPDDIFGLDSEKSMSDYGVYTEEAIPKKLLIFDKEKEINVCAYCRVSTDKRDQTNSFEAQKAYFYEAFNRRSNWKLKTIFKDNGISGTMLKKRDGFEQMIREAKAGKYQLIITKSVSRFSRNVEHILTFVEDLRRHGVYIWFITDKICTDSDNYRKPLISASDAAEAESRAASERVRWGQRYKMQQGVVFGRKEMFGYNIKRDDNGKQYFEIIPDEAEIVRRIFRMYADDIGTFKIARKLEEEGIKTKRYKNGWSNTVILRILRNEKYVGDLKQGKTYTVDYISHQKKYNHNKEYATHFAPNHHPESAIISRDLWELVQKKLKENSPSDEVKEKHSNRYWCSGKIFCGECNGRYISHTRKLKSGGIHKSWKCWENQQHGHKKDHIIDDVPVIDEETGEIKKIGCDNQSVNERVLKQGIHDILEVIIRPQMQKNYEAIKSIILNRKKEDTTEDKIKKLEEKLKELEKECVEITRRIIKNETANGISTNALNMTLKSVEEEMTSVQNEITTLKNTDIIVQAENAEMLLKLDNLKQIVELKDNKISEDLYRTIVDKIEVFQGHILKYYIAGWDKPIVMKYTTKGKMDKYEIMFEILEA